MHEAARLQFERVVREFAQWRAVPEVDRSPTPAWWWQPAFVVMEQQDQMPPQWCQHVELPLSANYAAGVAALMASLADQTSLPWSEEFPRKIHASEKSQNE
jgi:hypothetical protein